MGKLFTFILVFAKGQRKIGAKDHRPPIVNYLRNLKGTSLNSLPLIKKINKID